MKYSKHFIPLESNPELFSELAHQLGLSGEWAFQDVLSLDDSEVLSLIPRPAIALVLVFPTSPAYEAHIAGQDGDRSEYDQRGDEEDVIWYRQTINNACGLYAILHAISNGSAQKSILRSGSILEELLRSVGGKGPAERARALEESADLEHAYAQVALQGDTDPPEHAENEVDFHYVCFVKSHKDGHLYELDGDRRGPVDWGLFPGEDVLSRDGLAVIREFIKPVERSVGFSLLALAPQ